MGLAEQSQLERESTGGCAAMPAELWPGWLACGGEENGPALLLGPTRGRLSGLRLLAGPAGREQATTWEE